MKKKQTEQDLDPNILMKNISGFLVSPEHSSNLEKKLFDEKLIDYSVKSLNYIERYLDKIREDKSILSEEKCAKVVYKCGAYVGEVIKKHTNGRFNWISFDDAAKNHPDIQDFGKSLDVLYVLEDKKNSVVIFPLAKVAKYINNGLQDSLSFYVDSIINYH